MLIAGVDEAGRGPLAGPVFAAAVILVPDRPIAGLRDSKALSAHRRVALAEAIRRDALAWAIASADVDEIDTLNILQATLLAMRRAVEALTIAPAEVLVDGTHCPRVDMPFVRSSRVTATWQPFLQHRSLPRRLAMRCCASSTCSIRTTDLPATRATALPNTWRRWRGTGHVRCIDTASRRWRGRRCVSSHRERSPEIAGAGLRRLAFSPTRCCRSPPSTRGGSC